MTNINPIKDHDHNEKLALGLSGELMDVNGVEAQMSGDDFEKIIKSHGIEDMPFNDPDNLNEFEQDIVKAIGVTIVKLTFEHTEKMAKELEFE